MRKYALLGIERGYAMDCLEAQQLITPYLERKLSEKELRSFLEHIDHCRNCYEELEINMAVKKALENKGDGRDKDEYDFDKLVADHIQIEKKYLYRRQMTRLTRRMLMILAQAVLIMSIITGIELQGPDGRLGTTLFRLLHGNDVIITQQDTDAPDHPEYFTESQEESISERAVLSAVEHENEDVSERAVVTIASEHIEKTQFIEEPSIDFQEEGEAYE